MSKSADLKARKAAAVPGGVGHQGHLRGQGREFRAVGRRWPALHRFRRGNRRAQYRTSSPAGHGGGREAGGVLCAHLLSRRTLRVLCAARGAAEQPRTRRLREEVTVPVIRRRGGGERHQDRALLHQAFGGHRVLRRLSRTHAHDHGAHRQGHALQARLRAVSRRGLSRANSRSPIAASRPSRRSPIWTGCFTATSIRSRSPPS